MHHRVSQNCTELTPLCPVENTIYGYAPNLGLNAFFVAIFALCALAQFFLGTRYKTYFFAYVVTMGCIGEAIGYGGRIIMHSNPVYIPIQRVLFGGRYIADSKIVFIARVQNPDLLPHLRPSFHRSRHLPDSQTHCPRLRPR